MGYRDYYQGSGGSEDYLSNPSGLLGLSVPFGTWFGVRVRLHFWLLLTVAFSLIDLLRGVSPVLIAEILILLFTALMLHDFGHRFFTQWIGGRHDEFMLWPAGGMIFPQPPPGPGALFISHAGGMAVNLVLAAGCFLAAGASIHLPWRHLLNPLSLLGGPVPAEAGSSNSALATLLVIFGIINWGMFFINLLPYYWFDGGSLLQAILWPFLGAYAAINVTCIVGMIVAVPFFFMAMESHDLLGMIVWVLLFSSAYTRRRQLQATGTGELEDAIALSAQNPGTAKPSWRRRKWERPGFAQKVARKAAEERAEQEKIDSILAKVSAFGMHSLTEKEKRLLKTASERQRQRDAERGR